MRRIHLIIKSMLTDAVKVLEQGDEQLARDIITREREVDRLYFLVIRQLKSAVQYQQIAEKLGIENQRDSLGRIASYSSDIAEIALNLSVEA
jgi:phosphate uptake regulator